jgi:carbamoyltransferase
MTLNQKEWILSLSVAQHDASITLLYGSEIVLYIQEERVCRIKHDGTVPLLCLHLIKKYTDTIDTLLMVNVGQNKSKIINNHIEKLGISVKKVFTDDFHHLHHAACGFYGSGFDEAICLVMDGWGSASRFFYSSEETQNNRDGGISCDETTTIFKASYPGNFSVLYKNLIYDPYRTDGLNQIDCSHREDLLKEKKDGFSLKKFFESNGNDVEVSSHFDIGVMYGVVSSFLGHSELECGKIMGLASYGERDEFIPSFFCNDQLKCNMNLFSQSRFVNTFNYPHLEEYLNSFEKRANIAYAIQDALEKKLLKFNEYIDKGKDVRKIFERWW